MLLLPVACALLTSDSPHSSSSVRRNGWGVYSGLSTRQARIAVWCIGRRAAPGLGGLGCLRYKRPAMRDPAQLLVRYPHTVVLSYVVATVLLGFAARNVRIEGSVESILPFNDPAVQYYADVRAQFGSGDIAVVGVRAPHVFNVPTLTKIARVTDRLAALDGVEQVVSLTNTVDPAADVFSPPKLLPNIPPTPEDVAALKAKIASAPFYAKFAKLLFGISTDDGAADYQGAAINVVFRPLSDSEYADLRIDEHIAEILAGETSPERFFYIGASRVQQEAVRLMRQDLLRFTPVALICVLVILWFAFRRLRAVVLPIMTVVIAVVWTFGIMGLVGKPLSLGTFMLPPLMLVIGSAQAMHIIAAYYEQQRAHRKTRDAVLEGLRQVWSPLLISAFTTAVGFGALMISPITAIWDLGLLSMLGVVSHHYLARLSAVGAGVVGSLRRSFVRRSSRVGRSWSGSRLRRTRPAVSCSARRCAGAIWSDRGRTDRRRLRLPELLRQEFAGA